MGRKRNPCIDVTYSGEQYEKDRELMVEFHIEVGHL